MKYLLQHLYSKVFHVFKHEITQINCCLLRIFVINVLQQLMKKYSLVCSRQIISTAFQHQEYHQTMKYLLQHLYSKVFHVFKHEITQVNCCLLMKKILPGLQQAHNHHSILALEVSANHEIPFATPILKGISCV